MKKILAFAIFLIFMSCEDSIKFQQPQPSNKNNLNKIPRRLRGTYISIPGSTYLTVNDLGIIKWLNLEVKTIKDSIDIDIDSVKIIKQRPGRIHVVDDKYDLKLSFFPDDSVLVQYSYRDTLFRISDRNILRRFKGHYFLNYQKTKNQWQVRRLTLKNNDLSFSKVKVHEDIEELKEITQIVEIKPGSGKVLEYKLNPSRKELKQLMKSNFSKVNTYKRVDLNFRSLTSPKP